MLILARKDVYNDHKWRFFTEEKRNQLNVVKWSTMDKSGREFIEMRVNERIERKKDEWNW